MADGQTTEEKPPVEVTDLDLERSEVEPTETGAEAEPRLLRIMVVEKETRAPVPGAHVAFVGTMSADYNSMNPIEREKYLQLSRDSEKFTQHYGTSVVADSDGVVFAPVAEQDTYLRLAGRLGQLYGELRVALDAVGEAEGREFVLELEPDLTLTVQVLDSRGNPAVGVPIAIEAQGEEQSVFGFSQIAITEAPGGLAQIPHLQNTVRQRKRRG